MQSRNAGWWWCGAGTLAVLAVLAGLVLPGCFGDLSQNKWKPSDGPLYNSPFSPVALRIHPLTHVDTAKGGGSSVGGAGGGAAGGAGVAVPAGATVIVLHVELRDRWGDTTKGVGKLSVLLYKPGVGVAPGLETQELKWDVPGFDDPNTNMSMYDAATRTYRIQLEAPDWVAKTIHDPRNRDSGWFTIRAVLAAGGPGGVGAEGNSDARYLSDEYVLQK